MDLFLGRRVSLVLSPAGKRGSARWCLHVDVIGRVTCSHSSPFFSRPSARRHLFRFALAICFDTLRGINSRVIAPSAHVRRRCGRAPSGGGHRVADPTRIPDRPPIRPSGCRMQPRRDAGRIPVSTTQRYAGEAAAFGE